MIRRFGTAILAAVLLVGTIGVNAQQGSCRDECEEAVDNWRMGCEFGGGDPLVCAMGAWIMSCVCRKNWCGELAIDCGGYGDPGVSAEQREIRKKILELTPEQREDLIEKTLIRLRELGIRVPERRERQ